MSAAVSLCTTIGPRATARPHITISSHITARPHAHAAALPYTIQLAP
jgi:hypothetical protein